MHYLDRDDAEMYLRQAKRIAVLGIKPKSRQERAAHYIPAYLASVGYEIIPVPTRYHEETEILGYKVIRSLLDVPKPVDIVNIFLKPEDVPTYTDDLITLAPRVVWFQSGLLNEGCANKMMESGILIAHYCIGCMRAELPPPCKPLPGQG